MDKVTFTSSIRSSIAEKLKEARRGCGLSTRAVAEQLGPSLPVSHATIANYEKGRTQPSLAILTALAGIYGRPVNWFLERGPSLSGIRYRNQPSKLRVSDRHRYEAEALRWMEGYIAIENYLGKPLTASRQPPEISHPVDPARVAAAVRRELSLDQSCPIPSVIDALEAFGIRVIEVPTDLRIDGFAAMLGDKPVVVLNSSRPSDRMRLNAAHELFHVLLGHCSGDDQVSESSDSEHEDIAFACARLFLLPKPQLESAFREQSFVRLVKFREEFGISLSAMIYAARQEGILSDKWARHLWIEIGRRGWRVKEPGEVRADRACRFEHLVDKEIFNGRLTAAEAARIAGVREEELIKRIRLATGVESENEVQAELGSEGGAEPMYGLRLAK